MLQRLIRRSGIDPNQFYHTIAEDGWWREAINLGVKVVMPLGEQPLRHALQESGIARWRGRVAPHPEFPWHTIPSFRPSYLLHRRAIPGVRDPEIMRNPPRWQGRWMRDLHYTQHVARHGFERHAVNYLLDPDPATFYRWATDFLRVLAEARVRPRLSFDIETPYKAKNEQEDELEEKEQQSDLNLSIIRISFAYREYEAVTVPYLGPYKEAISMLLESDSEKVVWNGRVFDIPVLELNGHRTNGRVFDGMDVWKFLQPDLDRGLEVVSADATDVLPWKHLSDARPDWYSAADSDVALRNMNYALQKIAEQGAMEVLLETVVDLMPELDQANRHGNAIDLKYQEELRAELKVEQRRLDAEIQQVVPEEVRVRKRYKRTPEVDVLQGWTEERFTTPDGRTFVPVMAPNEVKVCTNCGAVDVTKGDHTGFKVVSKTLVSERHHAKKCPLGMAGPFALKFSEETTEGCTCPKGWPKKEWQVVENPCYKAELKLETHLTQEWDEILPFNAASSQQLIAYMKHYGHPVGTNKDNPDAEGADSKHLTMLSKKFKNHRGNKHPVYGLAVDKHKVDKAESTYLWIPRADGRIGQTYVNSPATLRLGGRSYNLMNVGKRYDPDDPETGNKWAWLARNQIIAGPGMVLVQADSSSAEAVIQGWFMGDPHYMWLANQSVHAWLVTKKMGWDFNPDTIKRVKKEQKNLYDAMKVMNYRTNFGGSAYSAYKDNPDVFPTLRAAEAAQNLLFELIPSLEAYQYQVRYMAHKQGYLETPWKFRHPFYDVFTYKRNPRTGEVEYTERGRPKLKLGKDGKRAVALFPQHSNAMFLRQNARRIFASKWAQYVPANFLVHDGYTLEVPTSMGEEAAEFLASVLTRPIPELGGLRLGCEVEIGKNWGSYHAVHNPNGMKGVSKVVIEKQELAFMPTSAIPEEMLRAA